MRRLTTALELTFSPSRSRSSRWVAAEQHVVVRDGHATLIGPLLAIWLARR